MTNPPGHRIRIQLPFEVPGDSMPQPDAAVVTHEQMCRRPHPDKAILLIEISDSSLEFDQEIAFDYAAALVPEYWIVNMRDRSIEVYREPVADLTAPLGYRYAWHRIFHHGESISPLSKPIATVTVESLTAAG